MSLEHCYCQVSVQLGASYITKYHLQVLWQSGCDVVVGAGRLPLQAELHFRLAGHMPRDQVITVRGTRCRETVERATAGLVPINLYIINLSLTQRKLICENNIIWVL